MSDTTATARPIPAVARPRAHAAHGAAAARAARAALVLAGAAAGLLWLAAMTYILVQLVTWWVLLPEFVSLPTGRPWLR